MPAWRYADFVAVTGPAWRALCPTADFRIATHPDDTATQAAALEAGAYVHVTDAWIRPGPVRNARGDRPVLNKALALDEAFGFVGDMSPPAVGEICVSIDADVYPLGAMPPDEAIASDVLYGCPRYECLTPAALEAHRAGRYPLARMKLLQPRSRKHGEPANQWNTAGTPEQAARKGLGYFQCFRYRPGFRFGSYWNAARYDKDVWKQFASKAAMPGLYVLHLGTLDQRNWSGRTVAPWNG